MNCFSNVEKWFMNQKEKCSPKPASINNDFYSWIPPMVSFIFWKDGNYRITVQMGVRDKQGSQVWKDGRGGPDTAAWAVGCDWLRSLLRCRLLSNTCWINTVTHFSK